MNNFTPIARADVGGVLRGRWHRCRVTWPSMIGLITIAGGGHLLRGKNFNSTVDVSTWADAGLWWRARSAAAVLVGRPVQTGAAGGA